MSRRPTDRRTLELRTRCPACGYKIAPNEILRLNQKYMRCPSCLKRVQIGTWGVERVASVTIKHKE